MSTFLVAFVHPAEVFEGGNPFLATMTGEFIAKNVVLIAAALAVAAFSRARRAR
jgi:putative oxidoreductase